MAKNLKKTSAKNVKLSSEKTTIKTAAKPDTQAEKQRAEIVALREAGNKAFNDYMQKTAGTQARGIFQPKRCAFPAGDAANVNGESHRDRAAYKALQAIGIKSFNIETGLNLDRGVIRRLHGLGLLSYNNGTYTVAAN